MAEQVRVFAAASHSSAVTHRCQRSGRTCECPERRAQVDNQALKRVSGREGRAVPTDLTVVLVNKPGSDAAAMQALGRAGINIEGITGSGCGGEGILHILVADGPAARRALESAGQVVREEREVLVVQV